MNLIMGISWCGGLPFFFCTMCALLLPSTNVAWGDSAESENFETKYQTALDLISHSKSNRDFRRGVSILEDLSLGVGRISADSLAELSTVYLAGNRQGFLNLPKAAQYSQRSAALGSPKGRHLYAFFLVYGGIGGVAKNETEGWRQQELAAEQNYLPALMASGYRKLYTSDDCEAALRLYRAGAISAMNAIDTVYYSDFYSLRHLTMAVDSLGDDYVAKAARDVETLSYWNFQSDRKDPRAFYELGRIYQLGLHGVRVDMTAAADHFEKASTLGHAGALGELGRMYTLGHGRELDFNLALKFLQKGAEALDSNALATIGSLLIRKVYSSDDSNMALLYLRKAVFYNNIDAEWELAQIELREGRLDSALQHLQRAERGGHVRATMALGQLYDNGMGGLKQSCSQAVLLYKKVCETGPWADSQYGPREGVKEFRRGRESSALTLSLLAALEGYEVAQYNAAWILMRSKGMEEGTVVFSPNSKKNVKMRYETAASLLLSLSSQNAHNAESNVLLGDIFMGGYQVPHNLNRSALFFERAAEAGNALGMERLALLLVNGRGVPQKDSKRAVQLMVHAMSQISSGQSKIVGVQAILKQVVLTYRIVFLRLCGFLGEKFSVAYVHQAAVRVKRIMADYTARWRFTPEETLQISGGKGHENENEKGGAGGGEDDESRVGGSSDSFVQSAITFPSVRHQHAEADRGRAPITDNYNQNDDVTATFDGSELRKEHNNVQEKSQIGGEHLNGAQHDNISQREKLNGNDEKDRSTASSMSEDKDRQNERDKNRDRGDWGKRRGKEEKGKKNNVEEREEKGRWRRKSKTSSESRGKDENKDKDKGKQPPVTPTSTSTPVSPLPEVAVGGRGQDESGEAGADSEGVFFTTSTSSGHPTPSDINVNGNAGRGPVVRLGQKTGHYHPAARHPSTSHTPSSSTSAPVTADVPAHPYPHSDSHSPSDVHQGGNGLESEKNGVGRGGGHFPGFEATGKSGMTNGNRNGDGDGYISTDHPSASQPSRTSTQPMQTESAMREDGRANATSTSSASEQGRSRRTVSWSALGDLSLLVDSIRSPLLSATSSVYSYFYTAKPSSSSSLDVREERQRSADDVFVEEDQREGDRIAPSVTVNSNP